MPRYFCLRYDTDMGYPLYGVALEALTVVSIANGRKAEDYLPQSLLDLYRPLKRKTVTCSTVHVSLRYVYIQSDDGTEHRIHLPVNGYDSRWESVIKQYRDDPSIKSFRIGGETIREERLPTLLNK
ncbi:MAG: hypothetical protein AAGA60_32680 [Cyanobacteria bacterium P01_E01_bin.42]